MGEDHRQLTNHGKKFSISKVVGSSRYQWVAVNNNCYQREVANGPLIVGLPLVIILYRRDADGVNRWYFLVFL